MNKTRWSEVTEAELAATGKVRRGSVSPAPPGAKLAQEPTQSTQERRSKYGATPTTVDGIRFHSAKEARRYGELKLLEKAGEIEELELQPRFELSVPSTTGTLYGAARALAGTFDGRIGEYRGDFKYYEIKTGQRVVEDVKGFKTPLYRWKKKHCEIQYGIQIRET